ncbi:hypothetical protein ACFPT7_16695 [Acidicapsa dinghuensis]|uniref:Carboxypeptidase regulatory-like domain-containing protein n=2 Tax=Acidicapsa dinghuensis TaxID=2218256 RepID=A0ABW1EIE7_9BACT
MSRHWLTNCGSSQCGEAWGRKYIANPSVPHSTVNHVLIFILMAAVFCPVIGRSQQAEGMGRVIGHVYCADTNAPARLASVSLETVEELQRAISTESTHKPSERSGGTVKAVIAGLDGSFTFDQVHPGTYYVVSEYPGYLSVGAYLTEDELAHPTDSVRKKLDESAYKVKVEASQTSRIEVQLQRGASLSGTVLFDDGSPAVGLPVELLHRQKDGGWAADSHGLTQRMLFGLKTDDRGHFRITGLESGEVIVKCTVRLATMEIESRSFLGPPLSVKVSGEQTVNVFTGGVFRSKTATPIKLVRGTDSLDGDLAIPIAKLHKVSGVVVAATDEHPLNGGTVTLSYSDDQSSAYSAAIQPDGSFQFLAVPEDEFILSTSGAGDGEYGSRGQWIMTQPYASAGTGVTVHSDVSDLVIRAKPVGK